MKTKTYSEEVIAQTELAWNYLKKVAPLISYVKLVPIEEQVIIQMQQETGKIVPDDFRYWLSQYGSGQIEFLKTTIHIPNIAECSDDDGRLPDADGPANYWKRIVLGYGGSPAVKALDSTIIDEFGCAPIIQTEPYSDKVAEIIASSWPMYLIKMLLKEVSEVLAKTNRKSVKKTSQEISWVSASDPRPKIINAARMQDIKELGSLSFTEIDQRLNTAKKWADGHATTSPSDGDEEPGYAFESFAKDLFSTLNKEGHQKGILGNLQNKLSNLGQPDRPLLEAITSIEHAINQGYSFLDNGCSDAISFLEYQVQPRHEKYLRALLEHERGEVREIAQSSLLKILPAEAEKKAESYWNWHECAESWLNLYDDTAAARRCAVAAEKSAEDSSDWMYCGDFWGEKLADKSEAKRCLIIAQEKAGSKNYLSLVSSWLDLKETGRAEECLRKAEPHTNGSDLQFCVQYWLEDFNCPDDAARCIRKLESYAETETDDPNYYWDVCAGLWETISREAEAKRCQKMVKK